jgi:hypothetical protein
MRPMIVSPGFIVIVCPSVIVTFFQSRSGLSAWKFVSLNAMVLLRHGSRRRASQRRRLGFQKTFDTRRSTEQGWI